MSSEEYQKSSLHSQVFPVLPTPNCQNENCCVISEKKEIENGNEQKSGSGAQLYFPSIESVPKNRIPGDCPEWRLDKGLVF